MGTNRATRIAAAAALAVAITPLWTGLASAQAVGGTICGTAWRDTDGDGLRAAGEPGIAGAAFTLQGKDFRATTDADGKYCLTGLPAGEHVVVAADRSAEGEGWTRAAGDSDVDQGTGLSATVTVTEGAAVEGVDAGFVPAEMDVRVSQLIIKYPDGRDFALDQTWLPGPVRVGEVFTVYGSTVLDGNVHDRMRADLTVPKGLTVLGTEGGMPSTVDGQTAHGEFPGRRFDGDLEWVGLRVRVDAPFDAAQIRLEALPGHHGDTDPGNNVLTGAISAAAPVATTTPAPPATTTAAPIPQASGAKASGVAVSGTELADTGVDPAVGVAIGVGLLGGGVGALWYSRRRGLSS